MMAGLVQPDSGTIEVGETVKIGYFAQEEQEMDDSQRVIDYVKEIGEYIVTRDGRISASQLLERFCLLRICNMRRSGNCREERKEDCIFWGFWHRISICF